VDNPDAPGGLLRRMVELHELGELRLDRTLFGLADGLQETAHCAGWTEHN
jgi:replication initiation protein RepC